MPVEEGGLGVFGNFTAAFGVKSFLILFLIFYTVFAFILYKQVNLMCRKLPTPLSPHLRFIAILNIGISFAVIFLVLGSF